MRATDRLNAGLLRGRSLLRVEEIHAQQVRKIRVMPKPRVLNWEVMRVRRDERGQSIKQWRSRNQSARFRRQQFFRNAAVR